MTAKKKPRLKTTTRKPISETVKSIKPVRESNFAKEKNKHSKKNVKNKIEANPDKNKRQKKTTNNKTSRLNNTDSIKPAKRGRKKLVNGSKKEFNKENKTVTKSKPDKDVVNSKCSNANSENEITRRGPRRRKEAKETETVIEDNKGQSNEKDGNNRKRKSNNNTTKKPLNTTKAYKAKKKDLNLNSDKSPKKSPLKLEGEKNKEILLKHRNKRLETVNKKRINLNMKINHSDLLKDNRLKKTLLKRKREENNFKTEFKTSNVKKRRVVKSKELKSQISDLIVKHKNVRLKNERSPRKGSKLLDPSKTSRYRRNILPPKRFRQLNEFCEKEQISLLKKFQKEHQKKRKQFINGETAHEKTIKSPVKKSNSPTLLKKASLSKPALKLKKAIQILNKKSPEKIKKDKLKVKSPIKLNGRCEISKIKVERKIKTNPISERKKKESPVLNNSSSPKSKASKRIHRRSFQLYESVWISCKDDGKFIWKEGFISQKLPKKNYVVETIDEKIYKKTHNDLTLFERVRGAGIIEKETDSQTASVDICTAGKNFDPDLLKLIFNTSGPHNASTSFDADDSEEREIHPELW
ncbi:DgyrCDS12969 [Dimorphilus gyrociliatus]|uniref:DgyrCDS12969 n=1 Tax=Dimorphilus gyrociliatus TaxID=2664684 RepID=A0A7I8W993_9ANNE|nr:DgyrCDS12969 [Dimorphilus gyrociliatus]